MADYAVNIDVNAYNYMKQTYITEVIGENHTDLVIKLSLDSSIFNFAFAQDDGKDFRIAEASNGSGVWNMWVSYWDSSNGTASIWFKIPQLLAHEIKTLYIFWGYKRGFDIGISDIGSIGFLFYDDFSLDVLNTDKWTDYLVDEVTGGRLYINRNGYVEAKGNPLTGVRDWQVDMGIYFGYVYPNYENNGPWTSISFYGTENGFYFNFYAESTVNLKSNVVNSSTLITYTVTENGIERYSYNEFMVGYDEPTDYAYLNITNRDTFQDYNFEVERQVHQDTRMDYFRILGKTLDDNQQRLPGIDWVIARKFYAIDPATIDLTDLYISYENIDQQDLDFSDYGDDVTSTSFYHYSDIGGDPYKLSDNGTTNITRVWEGDSGTVSGTLLIDFGRSVTNLVDISYVHYDSAHKKYFGAAKLSDSDEDVNENTYWDVETTTSGWACINFGTKKSVGCLSVKAVPESLGSMVKNFVFKGSNEEPRDSSSLWVTLYTGMFYQTTDWQLVYFSNNQKYQYYKLEVIDTYGDNVKLQEWGMYEHGDTVNKKRILQLRLHPVDFDSKEHRYPKRIGFYASNDGRSWTTLVSGTSTYTPYYSNFYGRWQRYSFDNDSTYWMYKLEVEDNWESSTTGLSIAEWEMVESASEAYTYRILEGTTDDFSNIWAGEDYYFDGGKFYVINDVLNAVYNDGAAGAKVIEDSIDLNVK